MERTSDGRIVAGIAARCAAAGLRAGVAESCTGGLVAAALAARPGASAWFRGGVVSYATELKRSLLGVDAALLAGPGPVSAPVAEAMAAGARKALGADLAVSVTGLAGPDGDPERDIPVGTVFVGWSGPHGAGSERFRFSGGREEVRAAARSAALRILLRCAEGREPGRRAGGHAGAVPPPPKARRAHKTASARAAAHPRTGRA